MLNIGKYCYYFDDDLIAATIDRCDYRNCICGGGYLVKPADGSGNAYQWYQKTQSFDVSASDSFPLKVKINYHNLVNNCVASDGEIEITALDKIK